MKNYEDNPRLLNAEDFWLCQSDYERLKFLVAFASLAPSSHNTQPWLFKIHGNTTDILLNKNKLLVNSDPTRRQSIISIGCAIKNFVLGAQAYGLNVETVYFPNTETLASIAISGEPRSLSSENKELLNAALSRNNNRSSYKETDPPQQFFSSLKEIVNKEKQTDYQFFLIDQPGAKQEISAITLKAIKAAFQDKKFTKELAQWMKPSLKRFRDGLVGYNIGIPFILSFLIPWLTKTFDTSALQVKMNKNALSHTPLLIVIASKNDDQSSWIRVGEIFEEISVLASRFLLATAVLASPIEIGNYHIDLQRVLGTNFRPQMLFRIGYPTKFTPPSPRLPLKEILLNGEHL